MYGRSYDGKLSYQSYPDRNNRQDEVSRTQTSTANKRPCPPLCRGFLSFVSGANAGPLNVFRRDGNPKIEIPVFVSSEFLYQTPRIPSV